MGVSIEQWRHTIGRFCSGSITTSVCHTLSLEFLLQLLGFLKWTMPPYIACCLYPPLVNYICATFSGIWATCCCFAKIFVGISLICINYFVEVSTIIMTIYGSLLWKMLWSICCIWSVYVLLKKSMFHYGPYIEINYVSVMSNWYSLYWHIMSTIMSTLISTMMKLFTRGIRFIARFIKAVFGNRYYSLSMLFIMTILYIPLVCGYDSSGSDYCNSGSNSGSAAAAAGLVALGAADGIGRHRRRDRRGSGEEKQPEGEDEVESSEVESSDNANVQTNTMDDEILHYMNHQKKKKDYLFGSTEPYKSQQSQQPDTPRSRGSSRGAMKRARDSRAGRIVRMLTPGRRSAESGDVNLGSGAGSPSSTDSNYDSLLEKKKAEDNNISNFCETNNEQNNIDNDEIEETLKNVKLEGELDADTQPEPGTDSSAESNTDAKLPSFDDKEIEGDSIVFGSNLVPMEGILTWYNALLKSKPNEFEGMKGYIAELVKYVNDVKEGHIKFGSSEEMEKKFNEKRKWIGDKMAEILEARGHFDLILLINLGSLFSVHIVIVFFLHYAPKGVQRVKDEVYNFCRNTQCCIHTMKHKLLNFQINEMKYGVQQMLEWTFGGSSDVDESKKMAIVDLIPFLLDKVESELDMKKQYKKMSDSLGLESFYILMLIPYCLVQMHILLFQECQRQGQYQGMKLQVHAASAYVAKYVFGFVSGTTKYLTRYTNATFIISFGLHPQAYLMGICKSPVYNAVREAMTTILVDVYRNVYNFEPNFVSKIMTIFGSDYGGIDVGMYSHIAKLLEQANLLDLYYKVKEEMINNKELQDNEDAILAFVVGKLRTVPGMCSVCVDFFVEQYETYELFTIMKRMEKFRAGCRLQYIAAQMPNALSYYTLPSYIKSMIKTIKTTLGKSTKQVFDSLKRIKKAQKDNGERVALLTDLASVYNQAGGGETGVAAVEKEKRKLNKLKSLLVDGSLAIEMVKNTARSQDDGGDRLSLLNKLASLYNKKGGKEGEGLNAIEHDSRFGKLVSLMSGDTTMAIDAIVKLASRCDKTFWNNLEKLKKYRKDYPDDVVEVDVNGEMVKVLTVDMKRENKKYNRLHDWLVTQNGHRSKYGLTSDNDNNWSIKAYERMGSIEQLALSGIDVTFIPALHQKAMTKRVQEMQTKADMEKTGGLKSSLFSFS